MKAKEMIIILTCILLGTSILIVGCKETKKQVESPKESQTSEYESETTEEEIPEYGKVDPEREKLVIYVKKRLSKYNSWVAKTTKGKKA